MKPYYTEGLNFTEEFHSLSDEIYNKLYESAKIKQLKANDIIIKQGDIPQKIYFLAEGVLRSYFILDNGKEVTTSLFHPFCICTSFKALLKQQASNFIIEALTDGLVFEIEYAFFHELCHNNFELMTVYSKFLEYIVLKNEDRYVELSHKNATERYIALQERIPNLDNIIPQYQIASSLGITPVQLSRIRAKLK